MISALICIIAVPIILLGAVIFHGIAEDEIRLTINPSPLVETAAMAGCLVWLAGGFVALNWLLTLVNAS